MTCDVGPLGLWKPTPAPPPGSPDFWEYVHGWEDAAWNAPGANKAWVDRLERRHRLEFAGYVRERPTPTEFARLKQQFDIYDVMAVVMGVAGADLHATRLGRRFQTKYVDFFLPLDPGNLLLAWEACEYAGFTLWSRNEPLDLPRDLYLAQQVVAQRAVTVALSPTDGRIDLSLTMGTLDFEDVWLRRRVVPSEGDGMVVASMADIVHAKRAAGRKKDHDFFEQNAELIQRLLQLDQEGDDPNDLEP